MLAFSTTTVPRLTPYSRPDLGPRKSHCATSAPSAPALAHLPAIAFRPGDILGFSGRSALDMAIQVATWSLPGGGLSHVGIIADSPGTRLARLWESTTACAEPCAVQGRRVCGVQAHCPTSRVRAYRGRVWLYRAAVPLGEAEAQYLSEACRSQIGVGYDYSGAINARETCLGFLVRRWLPEDHSRLYCSEYVAFALKQIGRWLRSTAVCPNRLCRVLVREGLYEQPQRIK